MRNLKLDDVSKYTVEFAGYPRDLCCGFDTTDELGVLYACDNNLNLIKQCLGKEGLCWCRALPVFAFADVSVVNLTYLSLSRTVSIGLSSGEILTAQGTDGACDETGIYAGGLMAMEWSPDQELVVLVNKENQMILMSYLLEAITEHNLADEEFGDKSFVTVGWGKKETQFHGSEGKQAAKTKLEVSVGDTDINQTPVITWRGDGQLFAVGIAINGIRRFKVFDREGHLQYTSEKQPGLEANLVWRPSGNLIATTQKLPNKYVVAFFEKNGLKHGDFTIPVNANSVVEDLSWSTDSEILALKCYDCQEKFNFLLLFTSSNYHWYLKQTLTYEGNRKILKVLWDNEWDQNLEVDSSKKLHVFLDNGEHYIYHWSWNVDHSNGKNPMDDAVVGVIDGNKLLLTAFRYAVVPPPMSAFRVETKSNINSVFFGPTISTNTFWNSNSVCVCTEDDILIFYKQTSKVPLKYEQTGTVVLDRAEFPLKRYNWLWLSDESLTCVVHTNGYHYHEYSLRINEEHFELYLEHSVQMKSGALTTQPHPSVQSKMFILTQSELLQYTIGGSLDNVNISVKPGIFKFRVISIGDTLYFLMLTYRNNLSINDSQNVLSNVSSIFVQSHFLLLTTLQHELLCTELSTSALESLKDSTNAANCSQIYKRTIERGAKLVVVVSNDTRTVFQLPRGNLEAIQPRPLSLKIIGEYLDQCKYFAAFDLMRKQRINLNLIYDHNPDTFLGNVDTFLSEIKNPSWLSLFLSDLENVDVTKTMYVSSYAHKGPSSDKRVNSKVVSVCKVVRHHLEKRSDRDENILPILTSFVKNNSIEDLERALLVVKELKAKENNGLKANVGSDEALRYLLYLVDVNNLYDIALGMYDFDMVLLIANKSQKDPKEYVPMLNEFNEMEENFKRFSINKNLKRFGKAVECLAQCGPSQHEELRTFVKYHSLFRDALTLFEPNEEIYRQIAEDYGLHLKLKKQFAEAGFIYQRGRNIEKAVECFKEALEWELAIKLAHDLTKDEFIDLCKDLVAALKDDKRHDEALTILEQYCENQEGAIKYAVECSRFRTALRLCQKYGRTDLEDSVIPALHEEYSSLMTTVRTNSETFQRHKERLFVVRVNKDNSARGDGIDTNYLHKDSDLYSDAGSTVASTASRGSSRTFRSSKNRRKHERKLVSLKEGAQYEDVALVTALHALVTSTFELRAQVKEVNLALCWFGENGRAIDLQTKLDDLLKEMGDSFRHIWSNAFILEAANASIAAQQDTDGVPQGIAALDAQIRIAPIIQDIRWKLVGL